MKKEQSSLLSVDNSNFKTLTQGYLDYYFGSTNSLKLSYEDNCIGASACVRTNECELYILFKTNGKTHKLYYCISVRLIDMKVKEFDQLLMICSGYYIQDGYLYFSREAFFESPFPHSNSIEVCKPLYFIDSAIVDFHAVHCFLNYGSVLVQPKTAIHYAQYNAFEFAEYGDYELYCRIRDSITDFFIKFDPVLFDKLNDATTFVFDKYGQFSGFSMIAPPTALVYTKADVAKHYRRFRV